MASSLPVKLTFVLFTWLAVAVQPDDPVPPTPPPTSTPIPTPANPTDPKPSPQPDSELKFKPAGELNNTLKQEVGTKEEVGDTVTEATPSGNNGGEKEEPTKGEEPKPTMDNGTKQQKGDTGDISDSEKTDADKDTETSKDTPVPKVEPTPGQNPPEMVLTPWWNLEYGVGETAQVDCGIYTGGQPDTYSIQWLGPDGSALNATVDTR